MKARLRDWLSAQRGDTVGVLVERDGNGRSEHYARVELVPKGRPGTIVAALVTGSTENGLIAAPIDRVAAA